MKKFKIEIKWAIIFTIASVLWMVLEKRLGYHDEYISKQSVFTMFFAVIAIAVYILALLDKKKYSYNGNMNWTQGFLAGLTLTIFIAILSPIAQYIVFQYISPNFFKNIIAYAISNNIYTQSAAETYFTMKSYIFQGIAGSISMGVITSAIVALAVKSKVQISN